MPSLDGHGQPGHIGRTLSKPTPLAALLLCISTRILLAYTTQNTSEGPGFLSSSSALTSWPNLQEGMYLFSKGIDPYSGGVFRHSPLYLTLPRLLFSPIMFIAVDALAACALVGIWRLRAGLTDSPRDPLLILIYMLNPCIFIPSLAHSTSSFDNACLLGAVMWSCEAASSSKSRSTRSRSLLFLALRTHLSIDTLILLPPFVMLLLSPSPTSRLASGGGPKSSNKNKSEVPSSRRETPQRAEVFRSVLPIVAEWALYWTFLTLLSSFIVGGWGWMRQTWGASLTLPDLTPNPGLWWYFFTEMFDHFRPFFLMVFSVHLCLYVAPICIKFQHDPLYALFLLLGVLSLFRPYPTLSDPGLFMGMWTVFPEVYGYLRHPLVTILTSLHALLLQPLFAHLWLSHGTGNANFYYATTLVGACSGGLALVDGCWAGLRIAIGPGEEEEEVVTQQ